MHFHQATANLATDAAICEIDDEAYHSPTNKHHLGFMTQGPEEIHAADDGQRRRDGNQWRAEWPVTIRVRPPQH